MPKLNIKAEVSAILRKPHTQEIKYKRVAVSKSNRQQYDILEEHAGEENGRKIMLICQYRINVLGNKALYVKSKVWADGYEIKTVIDNDNNLMYWYDKP